MKKIKKEENGQNQTYLWDGNVAGIYSTTANDISNVDYYLQDELGSPIRLLDEDGILRESYGYDEFGSDLYGNQGQVQPFGYTGYQHDSVAGTYFAQAREYVPNRGRFISQDIIVGMINAPFTMNRYTYCFNNSMGLADLDGAWPSWEEIKTDVINLWEQVKSEYYGTNYVTREETVGDGVSYQETLHKGGNMFTNTYSLDEKELKSSWGLGASIPVLSTDVSFGWGLSGNSLDVSSWKIKKSLKYKPNDNKCNQYMEIGVSLDKSGISFYSKAGGSVDKSSVTIPTGFNLNEEELEGVSYLGAYTATKNIANWKQIFEVLGIAGAVVGLGVVTIDNFIGVTADDGAIPVLTTYIGNGWQQLQQIYWQLEQSATQLQYKIPQLQQLLQQFNGNCIN